MVKRFIYAFVVPVLLCACASQPTPSPAKVDPKKVVILAPQGVSPEKDTIGFNALVKNLTQAFSPAFSEQLRAKGYNTVNVLDQQPGMKNGEKMAIYAIKYSAVKMALVTVETDLGGDDAKLLLRVQFADVDLTPSTSAPTGIKIRKADLKEYVLRSKSGDTTLTMDDLAKDFVKFLEASGRLKD